MASILVLTGRWPFPPHGGDKVRILEICRQLARWHEIDLIACSHEKSVCPAGKDGELFRSIDVVHTPTWRSVVNCISALPSGKSLQAAYYDHRSVRDAVAQKIGRVDVVLAHLIRMAPFVPTDFSGLKLLEMTDAISMGYSRVSLDGHGPRLMSAIYRLEQRRSAELEVRCVSQFDKTIVVSDVDRQYLCKRAPGLDARIEVLTNGIARKRFRDLPASVGTDILFIGNMRTLPNLDAARFFIDECLPHIRAQIPEIRLRIVGPVNARTARNLSRGRADVIVAGEVADFREVADQAFCGVAPMRLGAGIQNKILDYFALGLPCVTTRVGYEGLTARIGEEVLVADSPGEIVRSVLKLKRRPDVALTIAQAAQGYVARHHSWETCLAPLLEMIEQYPRLRRAS